MRAYNLVTARLLARKGIVDPTDFTSIFAWRLEKKKKDPSAPDVPDEPDVPAEPVDPYTWEGVAQNIENGTYKDVYKIGDEVPLDLGSEGVINMQVAAFDTDTLADGTGTAAITWVAKHLLKTSKQMNPTYAYTEGTGARGGWEKCELRTYLISTIMPTIPAQALNQIVSVSKTQTSFGASSTAITQTTDDKVWIPSKDEVNDSGATYGELFPDNTSRGKTTSTGNNNVMWWLRSASTYRDFDAVYGSGGFTTESSQYTRGICLGFCTGKPAVSNKLNEAVLGKMKLS